MEVVNRIVDYIQNLDVRRFYIVLGVFLMIVGLLSWYFISRSFNRIEDLTIEMQRVNEFKDEFNHILGRYQLVKKQRAQVNKMLETDQTFRILRFFDDLMRELILNSYKKDVPKISEVDKDRDYKEVSLTANLERITMKQLADLLAKIEASARVYTKKLEIVKNKGTMPPTLNVLIVIATLQPKSGA